MNGRCLFFAGLLCVTFVPACAQGVAEVRDTLRSARIVADRTVARDVGTHIVVLPYLRTMVAATGEGDVIKYIQTLPGVSTGAEGSSAVYVRGGNIGSNLTTLDGVPIYGGSHLLGLSTAYPSSIISEASIRLGGFRSDESNMTASHIRLKTADGGFTKPVYNASANTFLIGGTLSMPLVRNKVSLIGSLRLSPLGPAFRLVQSVVGGTLDSLSRPSAIVYDGFAKIKWLINEDNDLSFSIFSSLDAYRYRYGGDSDESMGWSNFIANIRHNGRLGRGWSVEDGAAYNRFLGRQGIVRDMSGTLNNLAVVSSLNELTADVVFFRSIRSADEFRFGIRERFAWFNPGTSSTFGGEGPWAPLDSPRTDHISHASISTLHGQLDLNIGERLAIMSSARLNIYAADEAENPSWNLRVDPEVSFLTRVDLTRWLALEATVDWVTQYYHTLEGIPLGWSVDLLVPTGQSRPPERSLQFYAGLFASFKEHHITIGAYDKRMRNLVYFSDASQLFSPTIAGWSHNIKIGAGTSRGIEFLYERDGERLDWRIAYTLSRSDRTFKKVNDGKTFPARFDRRHILNATATLLISDNKRSSISISAFFTFQSGHWETVAGGEYPALVLFGKDYSIDYFTSVNNYEMPAYIRLDLGCHFKFKTTHPQELNMGIYNVLNRHNPVSIIYDDRSREWRQVALLPIMPSFSYQIAF